MQWLGHTCFVYRCTRKILVNPFRTLGCTAKYRPPNVAADLVLISSQLLDEGAVEGLPGDPLNLRAGIYQFNGMQLQELLQTTIAKLEGDLEPMWLGAGLRGN